jgi:hypothetical protein
MDEQPKNADYRRERIIIMLPAETGSSGWVPVGWLEEAALSI